jgi:hypothetical protein
VNVRILLPAAALLFLGTMTVVAQRPDAFNQSISHPAITYLETAPNDAMAQLNRRLADGSVTLRKDPVSGYLRSLLDALDIPVESQMLVFSQGSLQADDISYTNPRAIYFNDTVSVGWVRGADALEIAAHDPRQGVMFYALSQSAVRPGASRERQCLTCHLTWDTLAVPGITALSTAPLANERAYANGFTTDHRSPFAERWGGWFVTGEHGQSRHMGNKPVTPADRAKSTIQNPLAVLRSVEGEFDLAGYPTPYSDVVALLVFNHQVHMANLLTRIGWEARVAERDPANASRVTEAARDVVDYMLFGDEMPLPGRVRGTSGFAEMFAARGPRDSKGRSLRDFDLTQRTFRYPLSYMVYSPVFEALPPTAREAVYARLFAVLSGKEASDALKRLTPADRTAVLEILRDTKKDLPAYFAP